MSEFTLKNLLFKVEVEIDVVFVNFTGLGAPLVLWSCVSMFALRRCHLCSFSCVLLMQSQMLVVSFTSTILLLKTNGHMFWQVAPREKSNILISILLCLNSNLTYLWTPKYAIPHISTYIYPCACPVCAPPFILKYAAEYSDILCT